MMVRRLTCLPLPTTARPMSSRPEFRPLWLPLAAVVGLSIPAGTSHAAETPGLPPVSQTHYEDAVRPVLVRLCGDCHDPADHKDKLGFLRATTADDLDLARGIWHSVAEQLRNRTMPPPDQPQPTEGERLDVANWIEQTLRETACRGGEFAGVVTPRRLNRYEYERTINALLGVEYRASETFPTDGSGGEGFNNNGETLYLPAMLMERYVAAAGEILDQAILPTPLSLNLSAGQMIPEAPDDSTAPRSLRPGEELTAEVVVYVSGDYQTGVTVANRGDSGGALLLKVDGIAAESWSLRRSRRDQDSRPLEATVHLRRGVHALTVHNAGSDVVELHGMTVRSSGQKPTAEQIERHRRLLLRGPGETPAEPREAARQVLARFARQAFRRPVSDGEIDRLLTLYDRGAQRGDPDEEALKLALKAVLVAPAFLFRIEADPQSAALEPLTPHELAARLSYFLWSTPPDDELWALADAGRLSDPDELRRQVDRMLDDPRSLALSDQFVGQWLGTHEVGARVAPDTSAFEKQFTSDLLEDLRDEPVHFFARLLREDRSLLELIDCDYAVINQRLSKHYGITPSDGEDEFERSRSARGRRLNAGPFVAVPLPDDRRGGVLGMGAVHLLTSYPTRTSPVLRGGWVLETLLGVHVPSPPPDVPALKRDKQPKVSLRDQLAVHRQNPTCAACHNLMDPLGFALENFDVLGRWREKDGQILIDARASLPSGEEFEGPAGLRRVLLQRQEDFVRQITRKMLGYGLGRSLEDADDCTVQKLTTKVASAESSARALVHAVVQSTPFRYKQLAAESPATPGLLRKPGFAEAQIREREKRDRREK